MYTWIADTLLRHDGLTLAEINERWVHSSLSDGNPITRRTFVRVRNVVEEMFDINIECDRRTNRYYIGNDSNHNRHNAVRWLFDTISVNNIINESKHMRDRILLEHVPSGYNFFPVISQAMIDGKTLMVTYQRFNEEAKVRELEPYCIKLYHQRWYMLGRRCDKGYLNVFALDRMLDVYATGNDFKPAPSFKAEDYFAPYFGVITGADEELKHIVIHTSHRLANYYRTLPLHPSQKETAVTNDYVEFSLDIFPTFDFKQELLSQADEVEVIAPQSLRNDIKTAIDRMRKIYYPSSLNTEESITDFRK